MVVVLDLGSFLAVFWQFFPTSFPFQELQIVFARSYLVEL